MNNTITMYGPARAAGPMNHYCLACGHYRPLSGATLRCADCDETWCREYQAKGDHRDHHRHV